MNSVDHSNFSKYRRLIAVLLTATIGLTAPAYATDRSGRLSVDGRERTYTVHLPDGLSPPGGYPVILAFHGGGMQGRQMERLTRLDQVANTRRFIAVYPDGINKHWNDGRTTIRNPQDDVGFVAALIARLNTDYSTNRDRIYATGISNGALFAERLGCDLSQQIAGIAPVAGTLPFEVAPRCHPIRRIAVMQISGTNDPIMPYKGGLVADFGGRGEGGIVLSVAETTAFWGKHNGCGMVSRPIPIPTVAPFDRTRVLRVSYQDCPATGVVQLLIVLGGGHTWPGGPQYARPIFVGLASRQLDASGAIADFFLSLPSSR